MDCVIIYKKDLDRFGKKIMKDFYETLHNEYMLTYEDVKKSREIWDKYLVQKFKDFYNDKESDFSVSYYNYLSYEDLYSMSDKDLLKKIEKIIKHKKNISLDIINYVLSKIEIDYEFDEDLNAAQDTFITFYKAYYECDKSFLTD